MWTVLLATAWLGCTPSAPRGIALPGTAPRTPQLASELDAAALRQADEPAIRAHHVNAQGEAQFVNRLILETSPYLLQHAHNPVDWYPWGDDAFERARIESKPVFMSVGYSTCHWCHVMEVESFEDLEIAAFLNEHFVCIKVDREERPDVDEAYMAAVNALTGRGGWPMTVLLTPEREPFFAGTYFPARDGDRGSKIGLLTLLKRVHEDWQSDPGRLIASAGDLSRHVQQQARPRPAGDVPGLPVVHAMTRSFGTSFDATHGGFGGAPKFPRPPALDFLLRYSVRAGNSEPLGWAHATLRAMAAGGIHDQIGGGFHRYSVDARWAVPHFEKMLYDNAQLASLYLAGHQATGDEQLEAVARRTLDTLQATWRVEGGGISSATDADSVGPDGERGEGWYFTWTPDELRTVLSSSDAALAATLWGVTPNGNLEGRSVPYAATSLGEAAAAAGVTEAQAAARVEPIRHALLAHRSTRPPPLRDDKVILAWNGLALSAFSRGARSLYDPGYLQTATALAEFVLAEMVDEAGHLHRTWRGGDARHGATLDDYALFISGLLDLHEATADARWLRWAIRLQADQDQRFSAPGGGWFRTADGTEELLIRSIPATDSARPSGNAVAVDNVLRLHTWTDDAQTLERADRALAALGGAITRGTGAPGLASATMRRHDTDLQILIVWAAGQDGTALTEVVDAMALPHRALLAGDVAQVQAHADMVPWVVGKDPGDSPTAFVCERGLCQAPTSDPVELARQLRGRPLIPPT